jgi:glycosyltransferase involved in cell wall biosynthesis
MEYLPPPGTPVLITLHLPIPWYPRELYEDHRPKTHLLCVSESQRAASPPAARRLEAIANGVDTQRLHPAGAKRHFALALGRICPEKGFHLAIDAARRAGFPLILAGQVFPYEDHQRYFYQQIVPRLDHLRRFIGAIGLEEKRRLLPAARCVVIPSLVEETSSLVAMEALACGTPVVALERGALREIVEPGRTGLLVEDAEQMARAIVATEMLDPLVCRQAAVARFSAERMCGEYLDLYAQLSAAKHDVAAY